MDKIGLLRMFRVWFRLEVSKDYCGEVVFESRREWCISLEKCEESMKKCEGRFLGLGRGGVV